MVLQSKSYNTYKCSNHDMLWLWDNLNTDRLKCLNDHGITPNQYLNQPSLLKSPAKP